MDEVYDRSQPLTVQWRALSRGQKLLVVLVLVAFVTVLLSFHLAARAQRQALISSQFHLPDGVRFLHVDYGSGKQTDPGMSGRVAFSEAEYRAYAATLDDPRVWRPGPVGYRGVAALDEATPAALHWEATPPPIRYAGDIAGRWGFGSDEPVAALAKARYLCYAIMPVGDRLAGQVRYRAVACAELGAGEEPVAFVKAALDPSTHQLHLIII